MIYDDSLCWPGKCWLGHANLEIRRLVLMIEKLRGENEELRKLKDFYETDRNTAWADVDKLRAELALAKVSGEK